MIEIRAAVAEEMDGVRALFRNYGMYLEAGTSGAAKIRIEDYEREIAGLPGVYGAILVAWVHGTMAGCVAFKKMPLERELGCEMKRLWVGEKFRGLGLGRRLVEAGVRWARGAGYEAMYLDTVPAAMPEANALYERLAFRRVARYNDNPVTNVEFFRLELGQEPSTPTPSEV